MPEFGLQNQGNPRSAGTGALFLASFESDNIGASGGHVIPQIQIHVTLTPRVTGIETECVLMVFIATLYLGSEGVTPFHDKFIGQATQLARQLPVPNTNEPQRHTTTLSIPIDRSALEHIEQSRKGDDVTLTLSLSADVAIRAIRERSVQDIGTIGGTTSFTVSSSYWAKSILPRLGYLERYITEIEVPDGTLISDQLRMALAEFNRAEDAFRRDQFGETFRRCRDTLNVLVGSQWKLDLGPPSDQNRTAFPRRTAAFAEQVIKPRARSTKARFIKAELDNLWDYFSAATKPGGFASDWSAAKHALHATATLLAFVGRLTT